MPIRILACIILSCATIQTFARDTRDKVPEAVPDIQELQTNFLGIPSLQPRDWIAILALISSAGSWLWSIHTSRRMRKASVQDDFWFRQVTYPLVVEPLLDFFSEQTNSLPTKKSDKTAIQIYLDSFSGELERHRRSSALFPILLHSNKKSRKAYSQLEISLDAIEDCVAEYCASLLTTQSIDASVCIADIRQELANTLAAIQKWHTSL